MVQTNMGMRLAAPLEEEQIHIVDWQAPTLTKTKKKVWEDDEWKDKFFYKVVGTPAMESWCRQHYGRPEYPGRWQVVSGYIVMEDVIYTHWKLCE